MSIDVFRRRYGRTDNNGCVRPCPACRHTSARAIGASNGFEMMRCTRCATLFSAALPADQGEVKDYASYYDKWNLVIPAFVERRLDQLVARFDQYRDRNRWLDIGCGAGALMRAVAKRGWTAVGTEVATAAAEAVRSQGFDVRLGELESLGLEPSSFDVVSAVEVLEHVPNPSALIETAVQLLRPGGAFYLTTPHGCGVSARVLRTGWSVMGPPEHLQLFSIGGMRALLTAQGLEVMQVRAEAVNPRELLGFLPRERHLGSGQRVETGYRLNEALSTGRGRRLAKAAINNALNRLRLGDALKVTARRPDGLPVVGS